MSVQELTQAIDHSLTLYLQEDAFPTRGWVANVSNELTQSYQNLETGEYERDKFQTRFKNWVYYATNVSGVTVPATASPSAGVNYFDYTNGLVVYNPGSTPNTPPLITYSYHAVQVIDGFPDVENVDSWQVPLIAVDFSGMRRRPLALGGGHFVNRIYELHVFGSHDSERDQMIQVLSDGLKYNFPVLNFEVTGYPLNFNGDRNTNYTRSTASASGITATARVIDWSASIIRIQNPVEKFKHRGLVTLEVQVTE